MDQRILSIEIYDSHNKQSTHTRSPVISHNNATTPLDCFSTIARVCIANLLETSNARVCMLFGSRKQRSWFPAAAPIFAHQPLERSYGVSSNRSTGTQCKHNPLPVMEEESQHDFAYALSRDHLGLSLHRRIMWPILTGYATSIMLLFSQHLSIKYS